MNRKAYKILILGLLAFVACQKTAEAPKRQSRFIGVNNIGIQYCEPTQKYGCCYCVFDLTWYADSSTPRILNSLTK